MRLAVLASGGGTILDAMLESGIPVALVVLDRSCGAASVAQRHDVPCELLARTSYGADFDRRGYTVELTELLVRHDIDLVAMAGFGTILDQPIYDEYDGRVVNTHPALLPSFPGWHAVRDALAHGVKVTGCTVHVATREVDAGPILAQRAVDVLATDTEDSLHERIKVVERKLYVATLADILERGYVLAPASSAGTPRSDDRPRSEEISA